MIGVSPAYFFSRYTTDFSVGQYAQGLPLLTAMGFDSYQLEVFDAARIDEWRTGAAGLAARAEELGLVESQFVAHFLMERTRSIDALSSDGGDDDVARVVEIVHAFARCKTVTIPIGPFEYGDPGKNDRELYATAWALLGKRIACWASIIESAGLRMALEIVPSSILANTDGFLRMMDWISNTTIGYNFDTGHAWSSREPITLIPSKLRGRIYGTHLKDTPIGGGLALVPGAGTIPWAGVLEELLASGYDGSLDLEIVCAQRDEVEGAYRRAKQYVEDVVRNITPDTGRKRA